MKTFELKYGCNPNQKLASLYMHDGSELPDGIGLVAVGNDETVAQLPDGMVDNQVRILHQCGIVGLGTDAISLRDEDAVPGIDAAAHDEVSCHSLLAIGGDSQHDATAGVSIAIQALRHGLDLVYVHWNFLQILFL